MIALLLMLAADAPQAIMTGAASRLSAMAKAPRDRFRIEQDTEDTPTSKDRAIAETGQRCQVVGARLCTSRPRALLTTALTQ